MAILRTDIERALDELTSQEEGMRFQGLAVVLGKRRWPQLIAHQRKKDLGLDAYAPASETPEKIGKGLAASITPTLRKISADAKTAKENFPGLRTLLFVTAAKVGNAARKKWGSSQGSVQLWPVGGEFVGIRHRSIFGSREPGVPREVVAMA